MIRATSSRPVVLDHRGEVLAVGDEVESVDPSHVSGYCEHFVERINRDGTIDLRVRDARDIFDRDGWWESWGWKPEQLRRVGRAGE